MTTLTHLFSTLSAQDLTTLVGLVRQAERIEGPEASDDRIARTLQAEAQAEPDLDALIRSLAGTAADPLDFANRPL